MHEVCEKKLNQRALKVSQYTAHKKILSAISVKETGMLLSNMWKFFFRSIAHSTWMRRDAMHLVTISSFSDN